MSAMRSAHRIIILAALGAAAASCGDVVRQGRAPVLLVVNSLPGRARIHAGDLWCAAVIGRHHQRDHAGAL